jgi:hypothetical protein
LDNPHLQLAQDIAVRFARLPLVEAVSLTGSQVMGVSDPSSDIDLYIYVQREVPLPERIAAAAPYAEGAEFNVQFWGTEDFWRDPGTGIRIEAIYMWQPFIEGDLERVLRRHEAWTGYSTAFLHSVRNGHILFDRNGWLARMKADAQQYPEALRMAIIAKNHPILRTVSSGFLQQIGSAVKRRDVVSLNHRVAAFLASYFDVLFALNYVPHPGEKRLIHYAETLCEKRPPLLREQVEALIASAGSINPDVIVRVDTLIDSLDALLRAEGIDPAAI